MMTRRGTRTVVAKSLASADVDADYKDKFNEVNHLLTTLKMAVAKHSKQREKNPSNWGFNGDLGAVVSKLKDLLEFLGDTGNLVRRSSDGWLTAEQVEMVCPACADKMRAAGIGRVREAALKVGSMTWDECIADAKKKKDVRDPEALCGWLKKYGPGKGK